jgi:hypothetical protein
MTMTGTETAPRTGRMRLGMFSQVDVSSAIQPAILPAKINPPGEIKPPSSTENTVSHLDFNSS